MAKPFVLEVCVDSLESALAAKAGGATRLELCANLVIGGTTPSLALLRAVKGETGLPVHALLRPRFGDFLYTDREFSLLLEEGEALLDQGADALVCGCLTPQGIWTCPGWSSWPPWPTAGAGGLPSTGPSTCAGTPSPRWKPVKPWGVDTILTLRPGRQLSGGAPPLLGELAQAAAPVELLVGAGVDAAAIRALRRACPLFTSFHMSGKTVVESGMAYRKEGVPMGLPGLSEFEIWRTDEHKVRAAWEELNRL